MPDWTRYYAQRVTGMRASDIRDAFKLAEEPGIISFAGGFPAPDSFPVAEVRRLLAELLMTEPAAALQYGPTEGYYQLRRFIAGQMAGEGIAVEPENILVTSGSQQALDLICKLFVNPGDTVLVELPAYIGGINAAINYQADLVGIPLDEEGLVPAEMVKILKNLKAAGRRPALLYVVPNFQNPTGVTMSSARRRQLLALAAEYDFLIIEDNPYGSLRYEGQPLPHLKTMDGEDRVLYLGSFSKVFLPGLRLGWIAADQAVIQKLTVAKQGTDLCGNSLGQKLVYAYAESGRLEPHIAHLLSLYRRKRDIALSSLTRFFPPGISWSKPEGGFFIWLTLPAGLDARALLPQAIAEEKVAYIPGGAFFVDGSGRNTIRLAFSQVGEEELVEGIRRLGRFFAGVLEKRRGATTA
ncbi:MAG TPA: PLP-dependent aminotransferase family protein [Firmicutes bacterium]|nr:PLP-dependent aminotransferase family protein [Bacillota bacterium]